jgi:hypothetical protein
MVCANATNTVTATPGAAGSYSYSWTVPASVTNPGNVASFEGSAPGTYTVVITNLTTGCSSLPVSGTLSLTNDCSVVQASQCGQTLATIDSYAYSTLIAGAQSYRWRVTTLTGPTAGQVQFANTSLRNLRITSLGTYAFATSYKVEVSVLKNNVYGPYGAPCTVTTPSATTQLISCTPTGTNLAAMTDVIYANLVPFATGYQFKITNKANSLDTQTVNRSLREFRMNNFALPVAYNASYNVEVAVRNTDGSYLAYGPVCSVNTPKFPTTFLENDYCGITVSALNTQIYAYGFTGAEAYEFIMTSGPSPLYPAGYSQSITKALRVFKLADFNAIAPLQSGVTYSIFVNLKINGIWGIGGDKKCAITYSTEVAEEPARATETLVKDAFKAVAYPNPFASNFMINVKTGSQDLVQVKVYDMVGRLMSQSEVKAEDLETASIGDGYPSGVYNVVVTQGLETATLRVVKR